MGACLLAHGVAHLAVHVHRAGVLLPVEREGEVGAEAVEVRLLVGQLLLLRAASVGEEGVDDVLEGVGGLGAGGLGDAAVDLVGLGHGVVEIAAAGGIAVGAVGLGPLEAVVALGVGAADGDAADVGRLAGDGGLGLGLGVCWRSGRACEVVMTRNVRVGRGRAIGARGRVVVLVARGAKGPA